MTAFEFCMSALATMGGLAVIDLAKAGWGRWQNRHEPTAEQYANMIKNLEDFLAEKA